MPHGVGDLPPGADSVELADTRFFPQERYQCGPAALATVLTASGVDTTPERLAEKVFIPAMDGSLQFEMLAATRTSGRVPYEIEPTLGAIHGELLAGRPVVVLQNLGIDLAPRWHYAVVVGIDAARARVILRSGTDRRRETPVRTFLHTWRRGDFWGFVALQPDELPAFADRARYLRAVAALEGSGQLDAAEAAWRTALSTWPGNRVAGVGLANIAATRGDHAAAVSRYRELLQTGDDDVVVRNNLAMSLAALGQLDAAQREIDAAIRMNTNATLTDELVDTRAQIRSLLARRREADPG